MTEQTKPETAADLLRKYRQAHIDKGYAESQLARLRQYRHLTPGMKDDRQRHSNTLSRAEAEIARINRLILADDLPEPSTVPFNALRKPAADLLNVYVSLVNSGDAGSWDPEEVPEVKALREALAEDDEPWLPMEMAPQDGTHIILAFAEADLPFAVSCYYERGLEPTGWYYMATGVRVADSLKPTGWQPSNLKPAEGFDEQGNELAANDGPDVSDGHDHEGFPGGCERFGHTADTCPDAPKGGR